MSPKAEYQPTHHRHRHRHHSPPLYIAFVLPPPLPLPLPPFRVPRPRRLTLLLFSSLLPFFHLLQNPPLLSNSHGLSSVQIGCPSEAESCDSSFSSYLHIGRTSRPTLCPDKPTFPIEIHSEGSLKSSLLFPTPRILLDPRPPLLNL